MPNALAIGISYELFWHLNPRKIKPFYEAYKIQMKSLEYRKWIEGIYTARAIASNFGEKFPEEPLEFYNFDEQELSEQKIKEERKKLIESLKVMQTNFELSHKK